MRSILSCRGEFENCSGQRGDDTAFSFSYTPTEAGKYYGLAKTYVVGGGEGLCTDNCGWAELFEASAGKPDLIIQDISWNPNSHEPGDMITITVVIENRGTATDESSCVNYYIDGSYADVYDVVLPLSAGSTSTQTFKWTADRCGDVQVKAVADATNAVDERDEGNNNLTKTISVSCPDIVVTDISFSKNNPVVGEPIEITATIKNMGNVDSGFFSVVFSQVSYYDYFESEEMGCKAFIDDHDLFKLKSGESADVSVTWNAAPTLNLKNEKILVEADQLNRIDENRENNNNLTKNIAVQDTSDFAVDLHGYHFKNYAQSPDELESIKGLIKTYFNKIFLSPIFDPFLIWAINNVTEDSEKMGHCYGMSATSSLYYTKEIEKPVTKETFYMLKSDNDVIANINAYQAKQAPNILEHIISKLIKKQSNIKEEYRKIKESVKNDEPSILTIEIYDGSGKYIGGHAIVAFNTFDVSDDVKNVLVYDNNLPGMARVVQFDFTTHIYTINYLYYDYTTGEKRYAKYPTSEKAFAYESDVIEKLGKLIWDFISAVIKNLFDEGTKLLVFDCPINVTITDQYGRIINDEEINEIPNARVEILDETKMFFVPANLTYKVNISAYNFGNFTFTQISPIAEEIVSETGFMNISINPSTKAFVEIVPDVTDYTMSIDYDGDGVYETNITPNVNETIVITPTTRINKQIATSADDGYSSPAEHYDSTANLTMVGTFCEVDFNGWYRFRNVTIPKGANITRAFVTLTAYSDIYTTVPDDTLKTVIRAEYAANPLPPASASDHAGRTRTLQSVEWSITEWEAGEIYSSPDISDIIQGLMNVHDYSSGAAIQIFHDVDEGGYYLYQPEAASGEVSITACTYDHSPLDAARLYIEYTVTSLRGDLNSDGILTPADAAIALQLAASGGWNANADVNRDSRITSLDALMIMQAAAGG